MIPHDIVKANILNLRARVDLWGVVSNIRYDVAINVNHLGLKLNLFTRSVVYFPNGLFLE